MEQEVDQFSVSPLPSDISSDFSYQSAKMVRSVSSLSTRSATSSRIDYIHELSFLFKKIHNDLKFSEAEETYATAIENKNAEVFDWQVFVKLLLQILDGLNDKLEYVLCLGPMLEDRDLILKHFGCAETELIYSTIKNTHLQKSMSHHDIIIPPKIMEISRIFLTSTNLMKEVPRYRHKMHPNSKIFLDLFREFYRIMKMKCEMIAPKEMLKDKVFHEMFRNNTRICDKIREIEESIKREEIKIDRIIKSKKNQLQEYQAKLDELKQAVEEDVKEQMQQSQKEMNSVYETSKNEQNQLMAQVRKARKQYNDILTENLRMENEIRERKGIVQQQLRTWLNRYDKDVGERTEELNSLLSRKERRQEEFNNWLIQFTEQETEFNALMAKKELEEKRKIEEKMLMFLMNRSARIIQRAWRKFMARRKKTKKKGKKGKK